jgi:uncharacterized protein YerC
VKKVRGIVKRGASLILFGTLMNVKLEIAERLHRRQPYNVIAKELRVSAKSISKVSRLVNSGAIRIDGEGRARFADEAKLRSLGKADDCMPLVCDIMRALGAENPKAGLQQAYGFIVKLNPYLLYYNIKTPAELITLFERKISELNDELNAYRNEDVFSLARRMGITEETIRNYRRALELAGDKWQGSLVDYLNDSVEYAMRKLRESIGYCAARARV